MVYRLCFLNQKRFEKCLRQIGKSPDGETVVENIVRLLEFLTGWNPHVIQGLQQQKTLKKLDCPRGEKLFELRFMRHTNVRVFFCIAHRTLCVMDCVAHKDKPRLHRKIGTLCKRCGSFQRGDESCCENS